MKRISVLTLIPMLFAIQVFTTGCAQNSYRVKTKTVESFTYQSSGPLRVYFEESPINLNEAQGLGKKFILVKADGIEGGFWRHPLHLLSYPTLVGIPFAKKLVTLSNDPTHIDSEEKRALMKLMDQAYALGANTLVHTTLSYREEGNLSTLYAHGIALNLPRKMRRLASDEMNVKKRSWWTTNDLKEFAKDYAHEIYLKESR